MFLLGFAEEVPGIQLLQHLGSLALTLVLVGDMCVLYVSWAVLNSLGICSQL